MCVRMQGNEGTTDVASGILGFLRFLSKTLGLQVMYAILHGASGRRREYGVGSRFLGFCLLFHGGAFLSGMQECTAQMSPGNLS